METAIVLCVPEAEPLVREWRLKGAPSTAQSVAAHVTLLYPFLPAAATDAGVLAELEWFFRGIDAFGVRFTRVRHADHDGAVLLEPDSDALVQLARALKRRWPECAASASEETPPHLTIVQTGDKALRQSAGNAISPRLPFAVTAQAATLLVHDDTDEWSERAAFPFGPAE